MRAIKIRLPHIILALLFAFTVIEMVPWLRYHNPMEIAQRVYHPGDRVEMILERTSMFRLHVQVVRELVRVDDNGEEFELGYWSAPFVVDRGRNRTHVFPSLEAVSNYPFVTNTYRFRGAVSYCLLGIKRTTHFYSEPFFVCATPQPHECPDRLPEKFLDEAYLNGETL